MNQMYGHLKLKKFLLYVFHLFLADSILGVASLNVLDIVSKETWFYFIFASPLFLAAWAFYLTAMYKINHGIWNFGKALDDSGKTMIYLVIAIVISEARLTKVVPLSRRNVIQPLFVALIYVLVIYRAYRFAKKDIRLTRGAVKLD